MRSSFLWLALLALGLLGHTSLVHAQAKAVETKILTHSDILYQTGANPSEGEKALCRLDIYAPAAAQNLPVLVWFHGGGLTGGDKATELTAALCRGLASEGFVVASANYRLNPAVKYPTYLEDSAAAVSWMHQNAAQYGGNPGQLFIGGHSAGGYIAALIGSDASYLKQKGIALSQIAGLVPVSGQMTTHFTIRTERGLPESTILVDAAAPLFHAQKDMPPMLLIYGDKDMALRAEENLYLAAALKAAGNQNVKCLAMAGRDHGGTIAQMAHSDDPVRRAIVDFLRSNAQKHG